MKKTLKFTFAILFLGLVISCGNNSEADNDHSATEVTEEHTEEASSHETHNLALGDIGVSLDNGKKWSANAETTEGILNMMKIMKGFTDRESVTAYAKLDKDLQNEFGLIFQRCTMTGEAHNQLHNYLVPMKDMFAGLGSSNIDTCKKSYDAMGMQIARYNDYFE